MKAAPRTTEFLAVEGIVVRDRLRALRPHAVDDLADGMRAIGLRTPISVRMTSETDGYDAILVTGHHRLEAAKKLEWEKIECFVVENEDEDEAIAWEIIENLKRAPDLDQIEKAEHLTKLRECFARIEAKRKVAPLGPVSKGGRGNEGGMRAAARNAGIARTTLQRATHISSLSDEAKETAKELGLQRNRDALEGARKAGNGEPEAEVVYLRQQAKAKEDELARKEQAKADRERDQEIVRMRIHDAAEILYRRLDHLEIESVIALLDGGKTKDLTAALRSKMAGDTPIMDRRYA